MLAAKKAMSTASSEPATRNGEHPVPAPEQDHDESDEDGVDEHGGGHRDAVGRRQVGRSLEADDEGDDREVEGPVGERNVDLAFFLARGVDDLHARQQAHLHGLAGHREGAGNHRLRGDDGRQRGQATIGISAHEGPRWKNGLSMAPGSLSSSAPWPK